jgi:hypothetical protein
VPGWPAMGNRERRPAIQRVALKRKLLKRYRSIVG